MEYLEMQQDSFFHMLLVLGAKDVDVHRCPISVGYKRG